MTIEQGGFPRVTEIMKISDTGEGNGTYLLEIKVKYNEADDPQDELYVSRGNDPHGVNPQIRQWLSENPDAPVHAYIPPPPKNLEEIRAEMPSLSSRQFRLGLVEAGISPSTVSATIAAMPGGPDRDKAQIEWEYATTFDRMHPLIATIGAALGLTEAQIDAMWMSAIEL